MLVITAIISCLTINSIVRSAVLLVLNNGTGDSVIALFCLQAGSHVKAARVAVQEADCDRPWTCGLLSWLRVSHTSAPACVRVSVGAAVKVLKLRHRLARTRCTLIFPLYLTCSLFIVVVSRLRGISACKYFVLDTIQYYIRILCDVYVSAKNTIRNKCVPGELLSEWAAPFITGSIILQTLLFIGALHLPRNYWRGCISRAIV